MASRASVGDESRPETPIAAEGREYPPLLVEGLPPTQKRLILTVGKYRGWCGECCLVGQRNSEATSGQGRERNFIYGCRCRQSDSDQHRRNSAEHRSHYQAPIDSREFPKYRIGAISAICIAHDDMQRT